MSIELDDCVLGAIVVELCEALEAGEMIEEVVELGVRLKGEIGSETSRDVVEDSFDGDLLHI
jgi:hypothetical protein